MLAPIFVGSLDKCLQKFADVKTPEEKKIAYKTCAQDFAISEDATKKWFAITYKYSPIGLNNIKVCYFMESLGYKVTDIAFLPDNTYKLGQLIAFNKIKIEDTSQKLNFARKQTLLRALRGHHTMAKQHNEAVNQILAPHQEFLDTKPRTIFKEDEKRTLSLPTLSGTPIVIDIESEKTASISPFTARDYTIKFMEHYLDYNPQQTETRLMTLKKFTGVSDRVISQWQDGTQLPKSLNRLSLFYFLQKQGYQIFYLENLPTCIYKLGLLITYNKVTIETVSIELGFQANNIRQSCWKIFFISQICPKNKLPILENIIARYQDFIEEKITEIKNVKSIHTVPAHTENTSLTTIEENTDKQEQTQGELQSKRENPEIKTIPTIPQPKKEPSLKEQNRALAAEFRRKKQPKLPDITTSLQQADKHIIDSLCNILQAALPLVQLIESDTFTATDRVALRELVGEENFFRLSCYLSNLCSEKSREINRKTNKKGPSTNG